LSNLGMTLFGLGQRERAQALLEESVQRHRELGIAPATALPLYGLAWLAWERGDALKSTALVGEALSVLDAEQEPSLVADFLEFLAALAADQGQAARGARLVGAAAALREETGASPLVGDLHFHERTRAAVEARTSSEVLSAQMASGRVLSSEEAVSEAAALAAELADAGDCPPS
jgi:hypothetical protein